MGDHSFKRRLCDPVCARSTAVEYSHRLDSILAGIRKSFGSCQRSRSPDFQEGLRNSGRNLTGLLQQAVRSPQVIGGLETCPGCECTQYLCSEDEVSYGNQSVSHVSSSTRRLDGVAGHERCIFPCTYSSELQEISTVRFQQQSLSVQSALFRTFDSPSSIYSSPGPGKSMVTFDGNQHCFLSGRLASKVRLQSPVCEGFKSDTNINTATGISNEFREVTVSTESEDSIFGDDSGLTNFSGFSLPEENRVSPCDCTETVKPLVLHGSGVDEPAGDSCFGGDLYYTWSSSHEDATILPKGQLGPENSTGFDCYSDLRGNQGESSLVVVEGKSSRGFVPRKSKPRARILCRRIGLGMGSPVGEREDIRHLDGTGERSSYQHKGAESNFSWASKFHPSSRREESCCVLGQHHSAVIHKQTGRDTFVLPVQNDGASSSVGEFAQSDPLPQVRAREAQRFSRRTQSCASGSSDGVDIGYQSLSGSMAVVGTTNDRPICNVQEQQASSFLFSGSGPVSLENGCNASRLVRSECLRISTICDDQRGIKQVSESPECYDDTNSSFLAQKGLVPGSPEDVSRLPQASATNSIATQTAPFRQKSPRVVASRSDRIQTVRDLVRAKGFSRRAAEAIANCRRVSSGKLYQSKWGVFRSWCRESHTTSSKTSIQEIANFLIYLRDVRKLSTSTIKDIDPCWRQFLNIEA